MRDPSLRPPPPGSQARQFSIQFPPAGFPRWGGEVQARVLALYFSPPDPSACHCSSLSNPHPTSPEPCAACVFLGHTGSGLFWCQALQQRVGTAATTRLSAQGKAQPLLLVGTEGQPRACTSALLLNSKSSASWQRWGLALPVACKQGLGQLLGQWRGRWSMLSSAWSTFAAVPPEGFHRCNCQTHYNLLQLSALALAVQAPPSQSTSHSESPRDYGTVLHPPLGSAVQQGALLVAGAAVGPRLK